MKGGCVQGTRKFGKRRFTLKTSKKGISKLQANIKKKQLHRQFKYVRIVPTSTKPKLYRVYAAGKIRK